MTSLRAVSTMGASMLVTITALTALASGGERREEPKFWAVAAAPEARQASARTTPGARGTGSSFPMPPAAVPAGAKLSVNVPETPPRLATAPAERGPATSSSRVPERMTSAADLRRGPSLYETGRVGKMGVTEAGVQIDQTRTRGMPKEVRELRALRIDNKIGDRPRPDAGRAEPDGLVNAAVLKREIKSRFALLTDCPNEVARNRRVRSTAIRASRLTLRWTILPAGNVADTQVVATSPADGLVMNCVKREMSQWSFTPPEGGAVRVERPFKFRSASTAR